MPIGIEVIIGKVERIAFKCSDDVEKVARDEERHAVVKQRFPDTR